MKQILKDKVFLLALICVMFAGNIMKALAFEGSTLEAGKSYYLYNLYQEKFLTNGNSWNTQCSVSRTSPLLCTISASGSGYIINTHYGDKDNWVYVPDGVPYVDNTATGAAAQVFNFSKKSGSIYNITYTSGSTTMGLMFGTGTACSVEDINSGYNASKGEWLLVSEDEYAEYTAKKRFIAAALNVDGMPKTIKIAGVYEYTLNPDAKEEAGATAIGKKIKDMGYDFIGLSEDFNYHDYIVNELGSGFSSGTHRGKIETSATAYARILGQTSPVFDIDGLGFLANDQRAVFSGESWTAWNEHYGYTSDGADGLIDKGYRYYTVTIANGPVIDVYIMHMDAETSEEDNAARATQINQLVEAILKSDNGRPILIMGDTNCRYTRDPLQTNLINKINADSRFTVKDAWIEFGRGGVYPTLGANSIMVGDEGYRKGEVVDKIWYVNNTEALYTIKAESYIQDMSFINESGEPLADHWPCVVEFSYEKTGDSEIVYQEPFKWEGEKIVSGNNYYMLNVGTGKFLNGNIPGEEYTDASKWSVSLTNSTVTLKNGSNYLCAKKNGAQYFIYYGTNYETATVTTNTTSKAGQDYIGVGYKIYGTSTRYINDEGDKLSSAKSASAWNDWLFISEHQYNTKKAKEYVEDGTHYYSGIYLSNPSSITVNKGSEVAYNVDLSNSNIKDMTVTIDDEHSNAIVYVNDINAVANKKNVVKNGVALTDIVITDGKPLCVPSAFTASKVSYTRSVSGQWGTIVFPTVLTSNVNDNGIQYYRLDSKSEDGNVLYFYEVNMLQANKPGAFIASKIGNVEFVGGNAIVNETGAVGEEVKAASNVDGWNLVGAYQQVKYTSDLDTKYYISGDQFRTASKSLTINPFRAYFDAKGAGPGAKNIAIGLYGDDEATRVSEITGKPTLAVFTGKGYVTLQSVGDNDVKVYGVSGNLVGKYNMKANESATINLPAGVYVVGGKKVLVK